MAIEEIDINDDLKEKLIEELRDSLEDDLHGYVICDYLSRDEAEDILDNIVHLHNVSRFNCNVFYILRSTSKNIFLYSINYG